MSHDLGIGTFLLAGLVLALCWFAEIPLRWFAEDDGEGPDRETVIGIAMLVGMVVLGFVIVLGLRGSAYP
jgi:hypothetical protein